MMYDNIFRCEKTLVMRLNACFQHMPVFSYRTKKVWATIPVARASKRNSTSPAHIRNFPLTKVPDISITLSWMRDGGGRVTYRRITRWVCPLRDVFRVMRRIAAIAKCNTHSHQLHLQLECACFFNVSNRGCLESHITCRAISLRNNIILFVTNLYLYREKEKYMINIISHVYLGFALQIAIYSLRCDFVIISDQNISNNELKCYI